jgi:hypothetical protein
LTRKIGIIAVLGLMALALAAVPAFAANPHYVVGPTITQPSDNTVRATGSIAGLGNQNILVVLTVFASQTVQCRNPGGNIAPGQTQTFPAGTANQTVKPENGRATFDLTATATGLTEQQLRARHACPNNSWTPLPGAVTVTGYQLQVFQGNKELTALGRSGSLPL